MLVFPKMPQKRELFITALSFVSIFLIIPTFALMLFFLEDFAVDEALCHPYLAPLHNINEEPVCPRPFAFDFEQPSVTEEHIKELIWRESVRFNPGPTY